MIGRLSHRHVVLLGVGHTNAHVLRMWRMGAPRDTDLTCISNFPVITYSGMLPAVLAGQVPSQAMEIDLVKLCASISARLISDPVVGIDRDRREVRFADRPAVPFDVLSIGIGSIPTCSEVQVTGDALIRIKPMQTFLERVATAVNRHAAVPGKQTIRIVVVGGGVAGIEIAFCLPAYIASVTSLHCDVRLVTRSSGVVPDVESKTRRLVNVELERRGVSLTTGATVKCIESDAVVLESGDRVPADLVIWATGAAPPPLLSRLGLALDSRGFVETDSALQSTSMNGVFAVGDTGSILGEPLPKAGVYAVRQGPILWDNLLRSLDHRPLRDYQPQRSFMKLINLGDGRAIGQWKRLAFAGRWVMRMKHGIDNEFMEKFRVEPGMSLSAGHSDRTNSTGHMDDDNEFDQQCRGCGCKLGPEVLSAALRPDAGLDYEDAAVIASSDQGWTLASTDFFSSPFQDAFLAGRIAALHGASDVIASGGAPSSALANVVLPPGDVESQRRLLSDLLAGARLEFKAMGATLVGGHTIVGPRLELGFTVIGNSIGPHLIRKGNLHAGDHLLLTKPLGVGVLLAAQMRSLCRAADYDHLVARMLEPQHRWAEVAIECGVTGGTDVTGFGLAGHLLETLQSSSASAVIRLASIPQLPGAVEAIAQGVRSTLSPANRQVESKIEVSDECRARPEYELLFDPQTCGGLLLAVAESNYEELLRRSSAAGLPSPTVIGRVEAPGDPQRCLRVEPQ